MMSELQYRVMVRCEQVDKTHQVCNYFVEIGGVERALKDILKENIEQQTTISRLKEENEKLRFLLDLNSVSERTKLERQVDEQQATIEQLKSELNDCEKFRYAVFKRIGELNVERK